MYGLLYGFCSSDQRFARGFVGSPHPASFRFHLTMDTLAFGYVLPATGRIWDLHPWETCAARRTKQKSLCVFIRIFYIVLLWRCYWGFKVTNSVYNIRFLVLIRWEKLQIHGKYHRVIKCFLFNIFCFDTPSISILRKEFSYSDKIYIMTYFIEYRILHFFKQTLCVIFRRRRRPWTQCHTAKNKRTMDRINFGYEFNGMVCSRRKMFKSLFKIIDFSIIKSLFAVCVT